MCAVDRRARWASSTWIAWCTDEHVTRGPDTSAFTRQFVDEARERLKALSALMLRLEEQPASAEIIADIFREAHSLKGSAQMLGFVDVSQIAHQLEDLFVAAKRDARLIDARAFDLVFRTLDVISVRVEELARGWQPPTPIRSAVHARRRRRSAPAASEAAARQETRRAATRARVRCACPSKSSKAWRTSHPKWSCSG